MVRMKRESEVKERKKENVNLETITNAFIKTLRATSMSNSHKIYTISNSLYDSCIQQYDYLQDLKEYQKQYELCMHIDLEVLPILSDSVQYATDLKLAKKILDLHKMFFALSARRILKNFALYIESGKTKKVWDKTLETVKSVFYYTDLFSVSKKLNLLRVSLMPSMGKSYIANLFVAQTIGNDPQTQILRITYADDLCISTTGQTRGIMESKEYREIFPRYKNIPNKSLFKSATKYHLCVCDCEDEYNLFSVTREGQSTGKRAKILIIDDLLKDDTESYNIDLHRKMVDRYDSTWSSRAEDDSLKVYLMGTMWANTDLLNVMYDRATEEDTLVPSKKFKYTEISSKGESVFIGVPALDENGQSTCPLRYSTEKLLKKKKNMSEFLWQCVYQQDPISPEGMDFDDGNLQHYDKVPECQERTVYATLDPARKGKNYVSMPIFTQYATDQEKLYVTDWLYQKKSMAELYDEIVDRIIANGVSVLYVENNIDVSLAMVLRQKLIERSYYGCDVQERYSYKNKEQRIKDNQGFIRNNIIFPTKGKYAPNSEMGKAMQCLNYFSFEYPNKFDDAPDSIAMMTTEKFSSIAKFPDVIAFSRKNLPI